MRPSVLAATLILSAVALHAAGFARDANAQATAPASPKCEVAVVNPVSGYAECVQPRGAPVEQPPPRPPPTPDECRKHPDLDLEACRQTQTPRKN